MPSQKSLYARLQARPKDLGHGIWRKTSTSGKQQAVRWRLGIQQSTHPLLFHPWAQVIVRHKYINSDHLNRTLFLLDMKIQAGKYTIVPFLFFDSSESPAINSRLIFIWSSHCLTINLCQHWLSKYGFYASRSHQETLNSTYITHL